MHSRILLLAALAIASAVTIGAVAERQGAGKEGGGVGMDPEHARLGAMCGTWDVEMTLWPRPGGQALTARGTSIVRPVFGGLFIEETIETSLNGASFTTRAWTGYNTATRQYEATRISSTNPARITEAGLYDDQAKQLELKADYPLAGQTWHQRTVIRQTAPESMIATSYLSFGSVPEWKGVEIRYTRKPDDRR
jgi:hypothetical protein